MFRQTKTLKLLSLTLVATFAVFSIFFTYTQTFAATTIVVNSTADDTDNDGECTLREAIIASNTDTASGAAAGECEAGSGVDSIHFNITGTADFTNGGEDGYTISPTSLLPDVTETVTINGYSQDGAEENTTTAPSPFDAKLLIELDGAASAPSSALTFAGGSDSSAVRGLVINNFTAMAIRFSGTENSSITGNYIGTDPTGLIAQSNGSDSVSSSPALSIGEGGAFTDTTTVNSTIGGLTPASRNIIAGNYGGGLGVGGVGTVVQGNYFGLGADGTTALGNSLATGIGTGNLTLDYDDGTLVGGVDTGATNVISAASTGGIQPFESTNLVIQGNYIGTDHTGLVAKPNAWDGITFFTTQGVDALVGGDTDAAKNLIKFNSEHGIDVDIASDIEIKGNEIVSNGDNGINMTRNTSNVLIQENTITDSGLAGVHLYNVETLSNSIVGNSIFSNGGLGIDLGSGGVTLNDELDSDSGPNDLLNYPENLIYEETGGNTDIYYDLDVPAGQYRVEFFSNTAADATGNGEGETYLGFQNITHTGSGSESFSHSLTGTNIPNISTTATEIDGSSDGFGATSEFSRRASLTPANIAISKILENPDDVEVGETISYTLSATNNGIESVDLTQFDSGANPVIDSLFVDFVPPQLTFMPGSSSNPDITCADITALLEGSFGVGFVDVLLPNHEPGFRVVTCAYTSVTGSLSAGETIQTTVDFTVNEDAWTNYLYGVLGADDPDAIDIFNALSAAFTSSGATDAIDAMSETGSDNFAFSEYPIPVVESVDESSDVGANSDLAETGTAPILISVAVLVFIGITAYVSRQKPD